jgi:hypothetical protein
VRGDAHRVTELEVAHGLARRRLLAGESPAQLTDDPVPVLVLMHPLADQRRAPAVDTAMPVSRECAQTATQQQTFEHFHVT